MTAPPVQAPAGDDLVVDRRMTVETPEHVVVEYPLAGPGSRYAALLLDLLVAGAVLAAGAAFLLLLWWVAGRVPGLHETVPGGLVAAVWILWTFSVLWGWFFWFEAFRDGQTPGKRRLGLRAVMEGGFPLTVEAAAIRNLLRLVDVQGFGVLGGLVMLLSPRGQRVGDLAAGTVVVRELAAELPEPSEVVGANGGPPRLDDGAWTALERYAERRAGMEAGARAVLARAVAARVGGGGGSPDAGEASDDDEMDARLTALHADERARRAAARLGSGADARAALALVRAECGRWQAFRALALETRRRGLAALGEDGVGRFAAAYRAVSADLARARTYGASRETVYALERLVGLGHNLLYRPGRRSLRALRAWLQHGFPALVRRRWLPVAVSAALLFGPAIGGYTLVRVRPDLEPHLVSAAMRERADEAPGRRDLGAGYVDVPDLGHGFLSTALIANNVQVAFVAFAGGIAAGVGSALVLALNGLHLGSVLGAFGNRGALDVIGVFVLPHGVIELTAVAIAGGAGLWMGSALLLPGRRSRRAALVARAQEAVALLAGVVLLLVVAGLVEGFVSPARISDGVKVGFAVLAAAALAGYVVLAGRDGAARAARGAP